MDLAGYVSCTVQEDIRANLTLYEKFGWRGSASTKGVPFEGISPLRGIYK